MSKLGIFLAEGFEEIEGLTPADILRRAAIETVLISVTGDSRVTGSHQITVLADQIFEDTDFDGLDGLILPGGMPGTTHLMEHGGVNEKIQEFACQGKLVAAICAAPAVLGKAGLLQGKRATCYPGKGEMLTGAALSEEKVVQDKNIITSRGMGTSIPFALALVEYFMGREIANSIKTSIVYGHGKL